MGDCAEVKHRSVAMRNTSELRSLALVCFVVIIRSSVCVFILLFVCVLFSFCVDRVEVQRWRLLVAARRREGAINVKSESKGYKLKGNSVGCRKGEESCVSRWMNFTGAYRARVSACRIRDAVASA